MGGRAGRGRECAEACECPHALACHAQPSRAQLMCDRKTAACHRVHAKSRQQAGDNLGFPDLLLSVLCIVHMSCILSSEAVSYVFHKPEYIRLL